MSDINRELYSLSVESYTGSDKPGVLATIGGKFSTSAEASRNDRKYSPDLWRSIVKSDRVKEMLGTKTFYGELSHPPRPAEFLSEVQMTNVSHNIISLEFDEGSQDLVGKIDILDTPSGQIANTLLKYGSKIGISSRGIVMDDGRYGTPSNEMTPDNYYLVTFDLVALPGITGARLDRVTESAGPKWSTKLVLESLEELKTTIKKAEKVKDEKSLEVLKSIVESVREEIKDEKDLDEAIKELSMRDDSSKDDTSEEVKDLMIDDLVDRNEIDAAVLEKNVETKAIKAKRKKKDELEPAKEDESGATQASDIEGPVSSINVMGPEAEVKKFLEAFEGIHTPEDLENYLVGLEGVEAKDGKVIINKDTVLFNTMLSMINTLRLRSDANPLLQPGVSITQMDQLDVPDAQLPEPDEDPTPEPSKTVMNRKSIEKSVKHKSSLESTFKILEKKNDKILSLIESANQLDVKLTKFEHENELLKSKLKTNYQSYNESLTNKDKIIKDLSVRASETEKLRRKSANEAVNNLRSYKSLESANEAMKVELDNSAKQLRVLKDKISKLEGATIDSRKDSKIRKLIEARELQLVSISQDEAAIRTANESVESDRILLPSDEQRLSNLLNSKYRTR